MIKGWIRFWNHADNKVISEEKEKL